jgi:hypothetical protein
MKNLFLLIFFLSWSIIAHAQIPGVKTKIPFTAVDKYLYKVGDVIQIGVPSKGVDYQTIIVYNKKSFAVQALTTVSTTAAVINGTEINTQEGPALANSEVRGFAGKILFFKEFKPNNGEKVVYAIVDYNNHQQLAIAIDYALTMREMISNNPRFMANAKADTVYTINETVVKSFSPNYEVKLLSAEGQSEDQTVTLTFLVSHKLVHQVICIHPFPADAKAYDPSGNEYSPKSGSIGNNDDSFMGGVCNTIPTNVPVKATIQFKQILSGVETMNYVRLKVSFYAKDGGNREEGFIELYNVNIKWM